MAGHTFTNNGGIWARLFKIDDNATENLLDQGFQALVQHPLGLHTI